MILRPSIGTIRHEKIFVLVEYDIVALAAHLRCAQSSLRMLMVIPGGKYSDDGDVKELHVADGQGTLASLVYMYQCGIKLNLRW